MKDLAGHWSVFAEFACYTEDAGRQTDPLLPTGTEKVPGASDKTVKSTE